MNIIDKKTSLYIHIPYCAAKCNYCDFNSYANRIDTVPLYFKALSNELAIYSESLVGHEIETIYIGGGTPSLIEEKYICALMGECFKKFHINKNAEITIECNPGTVNEQKLNAYKSSGINRISFGLQAFQDNLLKKLGRIHTTHEFIQSFGLARKAGFENINVDLIYGIPDQTMDDWIRTLNEVTRLNCEHISCYGLKIEEGTPFHNEFAKGALILPEEETERDMYHEAISFLQRKGLSHYELSNFCKPGLKSKHNMVYWNCGNYMGCGAGAHSYLLGERYSNALSIDEYTDHYSSGTSKIMKQNMEVIDIKSSISEYMILGLRLIEGISQKEFSEKFGLEIDSEFPGIVQKHIKNGLLVHDVDHIKLTQKGLDLANIVMMDFLK